MANESEPFNPPRVAGRNAGDGGRQEAPSPPAGHEVPAVAPAGTEAGKAAPPLTPEQAKAKERAKVGLSRAKELRRPGAYKDEAGVWHFKDEAEKILDEARIEDERRQKIKAEEAERAKAKEDPQRLSPEKLRANLGTLFTSFYGRWAQAGKVAEEKDMSPFIKDMEAEARRRGVSEGEIDEIRESAKQSVGYKKLRPRETAPALQPGPEEQPWVPAPEPVAPKPFWERQPPGTRERMGRELKRVIAGRSDAFSVGVQRFGISERDGEKIEAYRELAKGLGYEFGPFEFRKRSRTAVARLAPIAGGSGGIPPAPPSPDAGTPAGGGGEAPPPPPVIEVLPPAPTREPGGREPEGPIPRPEAPPAEPPPRKRLAFVHARDAVEQAARDVAEGRMTASREQLRGFKGTLAKIWKHNLFHEYFRQKEIGKARREILERTSLYAGEGADTAAYQQAMQAVVGRYVSEFEDVIHREAGETREVLGDSEADRAVKAEIQETIRNYAAGRLDDAAFAEERNRIFSGVTGVPRELVDQRVGYADNLFEIARQARQSFEHGRALDALDLDFEVVHGRARLGVRTEAQFHAVDRVIDRIQKSKIGRFANESTIASAVAIAYSLGVASSQRIASSRLAAWGSFGLTAVLGAGIAGLRENKRLKEERRQHAREMAQGKTFNPDAAPRRREMEEYRYETREASALTDVLEGSLYRVREGGRRELRDLSQEEFMAACGHLAEIEARIRLSDRQQIDLLSYSDTKRVEAERTRLDITRAEAKVRLREFIGRAGSGIAIPGGEDFDAFLETEVGARSREFVEGDVGIERRDRLFQMMKQRKVAWAATKGLLTGLAVGAVAQEAVSFLREDQQGLVEGLVKGRGKYVVGAENVTPGEYLRRWFSGDVPRMDFGRAHEVFISGQLVTLPEGVDLTMNPDGSFKLVRGGDIIGDSLRFEAKGSLTQESQEILARKGIMSHHWTDRVESETQGPITAKEYAQENENLMKKIFRRLWHDNDTPKPIFDKNELKLWWGGAKGTGIDEHGNFVYDVRRMTPDGSHHKNFSANAQELMKQGKLKLMLSLSRDTQTQVFEVPIDANGQAIIDPTSEVGRLAFENANGKAKLLAQFAEVAEVVGEKEGVSQVRILATDVGKGIDAVPGMIPKVEDVPRTIFDVPTDYWMEPPPVIPFAPRTPLERTERHAAYLTGYYREEAHNIRAYRERRSPRLENPEARLDHFRETEDYFQRQPAEWRKEIKELAEQIPEPMNPECKVAVFIPAAGHQEGGNISRTLELYKKQLGAGGRPLASKEYEVLVFVNHPKDRAPDDTLENIKKFQRDNPDVPIRLVYKQLERSEAKIGTIRKYAADVLLWRHHVRGPSAPDLILVSNDADAEDMSPKYLSTMRRHFEGARNAHVDAVLGKIDWDPEAYLKSPLLHLGTRFFQYLDVVYRHHKEKTKRAVGSCGPNFAFRGSIYAAVGGYLPEDPVAEDMHLGSMIKFARRGAKKYPVSYGGAGTRVVTNARRGLNAIEAGFAPAEQWGVGFGPDDALRETDWKLGAGEDVGKWLESEEHRGKLRAGLERSVNRTLRVYGLSASSWEVKRALGAMGVKYRIEGGKILLTDMLKTFERLQKIREKVAAAATTSRG